MDTLVFDVNETLLDLSLLRPHFQEIFGQNDRMAEWFKELLAQSMIATMTDQYQPFDLLAVGSLQTIAQRHHITLRSSEVAPMIVRLMNELPPHPDVIPALDQLRAAGYPMIALSNSPKLMMTNQLANAGLSDYFDQMISVEAVQKFKPHYAVYQHAVERIGRPAHECRMIAAHDWDITGAMRTGMKGAFVARSSKMLGSMSETPDIIASDIEGIANQLISA